MRGIIKDLDKWVPSRRIDNLGNVSKTETHSHGHDETHRRVEIDGPHYCFWDSSAGILHLFRWV